LGLLLIAGSFFEQLNFADNSQRVARGERLEIVVGDILRQKFIARENGLSNIKILFGNKKLKKNYFLKFVLADGDCRNTIYQKELFGNYVFRSDYLYDFSFPKIDNSADKQYCLQIIYDYLGKERDKKVRKNRIRLFKDKINKDREEAVLMNSSGSWRQGAGIVFRESYKNKQLWNDLKRLNERMSQYKPWFLKGCCLVVIVFLMFFLNGALIFFLFFDDYY